MLRIQTRTPLRQQLVDVMPERLGEACQYAAGLARRRAGSAWIALDVDQTILRGREPIQEVVALVRSLRESTGCAVVVITARPQSSHEWTSKQVGEVLAFDHLKCRGASVPPTFAAVASFKMKERQRWEKEYGAPPMLCVGDSYSDHFVCEGEAQPFDLLQKLAGEDHAAVWQYDGSVYLKLPSKG